LGLQTGVRAASSGITPLVVFANSWYRRLHGKPGHVAKVKKRVEAWNSWRLEHSDYLPFDAIDLSGAMLAGANLTRVDLSGSDLSGADLTGAELMFSNLIAADLTKTDFTRAEMGWTYFVDVNLSETIGLESCQHNGPSSIGIDTFVKSNGEIPETFLRGCGVPKEFITYAHSLVGQPLPFHSCFISYSTRDQEFASHLHSDLQKKGVSCWFAPHDMMPGKKIHEQIDEAIRVYDRLLLILSEHSMSSEWVKTEIAKARKREVKEKRRMLFPVSLVEFQALQDW